jgi:hypothetical protein
MTGSKENTSLPKEVDTRVEPTAFEANSKQRCVLCDNDHYCYLFSAKDQIIKAVCHRTDQAPEGWDRTGTAKDGRGIFTKRGAPQTRKYFPGYITLIPKAIGGEQSWDAPFWREAAPEWKETGIADATAKEQVIHYLYPDPIDGKPLGRVERMQWSDRRKVYSYQGRKPKTKLIIPQHWVGTPEAGDWKPKKGERVWPLYREQEAQEEVLKGGIVFLVGGEQAVEAYRSLGLVATTCQGGEANYRQVIDRLDNAFEVSKKNGNRPLLAIHPDFDLTGEKQFAEGALRECYSNKIPAIAIEPLELWPECPQGGDIHDYLLKTQLKAEVIIKTLETCISEAVDRQELEIRGRQQRARWQAPESWQGELGVWREVGKGDFKDSVFRPLTDFDLQIERELISEDGGGLMLQVKRTDDRAQRRVYIKSQDYSSSVKFIDAIKKGLGGGVICTLNSDQLQALIRVRLHEYRSTRQGKAYRLMDRVGQQADGTWVFKQNQFTKAGESTDENRSLWCWNPEVTNNDKDIKLTTIAPQSPKALKKFLAVVQRATGSNFPATLLTMGYGAAGIHYQTIIETEGAFPIANTHGDAGGGKTSAALIALALAGQHNVGFMKDVSNSAAYERLKLAGGLTHCLDDPKRDEYLDEFLKGFYNGKARVVRGKESGFNTQEPHSPLIVTTNHAVGENSAATQSRLFQVFFPKVRDGEPEAWRELPQAMEEASGGFTDIIKLGYPRKEVQECEAELAPHLSQTHDRVAKSLALVLTYARKLAELAEIDPAPLNDYCINVLCAEANNPDESGDSLSDFLDKLFLLESEAKVGPWNMKWVEKRDGSQSLAIYLPGVWKSVDRGFSLAYNRKTIESKLRALGIRVTSQRFHINEDVSKAWERAKLTGNNQYLNSVETQPRQCFELPASLLKNHAENFEAEKVDLLRSTSDLGGWEEPKALSALETPVESSVDL